MALTMTVLPAAPQTKRHPPPKPSAAPTGKYDCGQNVELRLSGPESSQGSLLLVELHSPKPVTQIKATWDEKEIPFWQEAAPASKNPNVHRALLGIDLEKPAGTYEFDVHAKSDGGDPVSCTAAITVKAGKFATESLKVAPNFVEPNPEQLVRAEIERKRLREIFAT